MAQALYLIAVTALLSSPRWPRRGRAALSAAAVAALAGGAAALAARSVSGLLVALAVHPRRRAQRILFSRLCPDAPVLRSRVAARRAVRRRASWLSTAGAIGQLGGVWGFLLVQSLFFPLCGTHRERRPPRSIRSIRRTVAPSALLERCAGASLPGSMTSSGGGRLAAQVRQAHSNERPLRGAERARRRTSHCLHSPVPAELVLFNRRRAISANALWTVTSFVPWATIAATCRASIAMVTQSASASLCHPATPCDAVRAIAGQRVASDRRDAAAHVPRRRRSARIARARRSQATRCPSALEHTCFEAFVATERRRPPTTSSTSPRRANGRDTSFAPIARSRRLVDEDRTPRISRAPRISSSRSSPRCRSPACARRPDAPCGSACRRSSRRSDGARSLLGAARIPPASRTSTTRSGFTLRLEPPRGSVVASHANAIRHRSPARRACSARAARRHAASALLAHPASVTRGSRRTRSTRWPRCGDAQLTAAFGPQHGLRGDKQDNMVESTDFADPISRHPGVTASYGEVRRPTAAMMDSFDVLLVDLQDVGCAHLHVRHRRCATSSKRRRGTAKRLGARSARTPPDARSKACGCAAAGRASSAPGRCRCATA